MNGLSLPGNHTPSSHTLTLSTQHQAMEGHTQNCGGPWNLCTSSYSLGHCVHEWWGKSGCLKASLECWNGFAKPSLFMLLLPISRVGRYTLEGQPLWECPLLLHAQPSASPTSVALCLPDSNGPWWPTVLTCPDPGVQHPYSGHSSRIGQRTINSHLC